MKYLNRLIDTIRFNSCSLNTWLCSKSVKTSSGCLTTNQTMKILNVAEKNDAAKSIAAVMSRNSSARVSVYYSESCAF